MFFSGKEGKTGAGGEPPRKFGRPLLSIFGRALFDIKRALQKGNFRSFAEKGRGPDPQDPPSCVTDKFEKGKRERESCVISALIQLELLIAYFYCCTNIRQVIRAGTPKPGV